jgi:hypothetical protein
MKPTPNTSVEDSPSDRTGFLGCRCVRHIGSTIITTAVRVELLAAELRFEPREVVFGDALASDGVGERPYTYAQVSAASAESVYSIGG